VQGAPSKHMSGMRQGGRYVHEAHPCMDLDHRMVGQGSVRIALTEPRADGKTSYTVRYAYICQKGYHPSKVNWVCQVRRGSSLTNVLPLLNQPWSCSRILQRCIRRPQDRAPHLSAP
jgi:hypothetical protein